jgi:hypothetical protein
LAWDFAEERSNCGPTLVTHRQTIQGRHQNRGLAAFKLPMIVTIKRPPEGGLSEV